MKKQQSQAAPSQGEAVAEGKKLVTVETVREYLNKDLSVAIQCLNAIQSDPDLMETMAHWMHGRWMNAQNSQENKPVN